jgi:NAD(P)-dependent dehydrogenase (short-subunit alcohol dehydrogenase family)
MTDHHDGRIDAPAKAIIMGAATGAGMRCARLLAGQGVELVLADSNGPALRALSRELDCLGRYCDVTSETSVAIFAAEMRTIMPSFDLLIIAAGSGYVRTLGMLRTSKALLPQLRAGPSGACILNVAPSADDQQPDRLFRHATSALGFMAMSRAMARQVPPGVRVLTCREPNADRMVARLIERLGQAQSKAA